MLNCTLKWRSFAELSLWQAEISKNQNIWKVWVDIGRQPGKKNMTEMQKVNLFHYLTNWRIPKQHLGRDRWARMPAQSGAFHPGSWQGCCLHAFIEGLHTCSLSPSSGLPFAFYDPQDRELKDVHESTSTITCDLYTEILFFKREDKEQ